MKIFKIYLNFSFTIIYEVKKTLFFKKNLTLYIKKDIFIINNFLHMKSNQFFKTRINYKTLGQNILMSLNNNTLIAS
jgi:hypothetical protein